MTQDNTNPGRDILAFLSDPQRHYLTSSPGVTPLDAPVLQPQDSILFRVNEITFEDEAPWKEALENVLSATRIPGINFVYLLVGNSDGVRFYFGLSRDYSTPLDSKLTVPEIGKSVLKASMAGNFRGSDIEEVSAEDKTPVLKKLRGADFMSRIEGIAGSVKDDERFQSVDRLVDVMQGENFCLLVVAKALDAGQISAIEQEIHQTYSSLSPLLKYGRQEGSSEGTSESSSRTTSTSRSTSTNVSDSENTQHSHAQSSGTNRSTAEQKGESDGKQFSTGKSSSQSTQTGSGSNSTSNTGGTTSVGTQKSTTVTTGENKGTSDTDSTSKSHQTGSGTTTGTSESTTTQSGSNTGVSMTLSREYQNRCVLEWTKYCDDILLPRLDYGKGKGLFTSAFYVMTSSPSALIKLENTVLSLYSGKQGNRVPLRTFPLDRNDPQRQFACQLQLPLGRFGGELPAGELAARAFLSQPVSARGGFPLGNWLTTNELAMIAGLPRKEVVGLRLREEVEFGLNFQVPEKSGQIPLGCLVQNGKKISTPVSLDKAAMDKHLFITGVTGSGKTTTCQKILVQSGFPFLVVEPAKTEYRIMKDLSQCKDLLIFTLGDDTAAPFRLNPFEFLPRESLTSHVDMMKASMEAAFDMEAAIPQLIERAIYQCYEDFGWDPDTNRNRRYADPFAPGVCAFPRLSDLLNTIEKVVQKQGFADRLQGDYIGSIRARLQSLTLGGKGAMLNTFRSLDWNALLDKQVIFELEGVKNVSDKSLIMGFILAAFNEAVKERYLSSKEPHAHILLVEEAHRLLSRYTPGDSMNKKHGVEMFSDMLAEIRKYGECLMIVDQIPNKMAEDVLKNTNTKIVHRVFAQDDKEAIGNTMALEEEQKQFLSNLGTGRAILFSDNAGEAMQVQIARDTDTSLTVPSSESLREKAFRYYWSCGQEIFLKLRKDPFTLPEPDCLRALEFIRRDVLSRLLDKWKPDRIWEPEYAQELRWMLDQELFTPEDAADWLIRHNRVQSETLGTDREQGCRDRLSRFIADYPKGEDAVALSNV